ncbi:MAG: S-adenosylmethionine:tRNA ribosyltransferase-isomerase [Clostridium sp.]|nr:S-adenosylmethionine:tRNA ribosyltransferase-isomerase [Clostridium sp.]
MQETKHIRIKDYDYELPDERIAKYPLAERDASKLLVYQSGEIHTERFTALPGLLPKGALMVFNNTKVIQARLHFRKETGALIEVFCLEPLIPNDYVLMFQRQHRCSWLCLVGNLKKWKTGELCRTVEIAGSRVTLRARRISDEGTSHRVEFEWDGDGVTWADVLEAVGELPIPPYLNRATEERDKQTYQTVYSKIKGSVAAPTAGLHFTPRVLDELDARGIDREEVTLHVGAGTFKPVKSREIEGHEMHTEYICVHRRTVEKLIKHAGACIAVGTTSVRTLESLYYIGVILNRRPEASAEELHVSQWMPYEYAGQTRPAGSPDDGRPEALTTLQALHEILAYMDRNGVEALHTSTQIIIAPGYSFHVVRMMVTNFHQPQSTLLLLVSAFLHGDWRSVYRYALAEDYRFLSYGDSSLLIPSADSVVALCRSKIEDA